MINPFDDTVAKEYCKKLIDDLQKYRCLDFELSVEKRNPLFSTDSLFTEGGGAMFGILVCQDSTNSEKPIILKAFSGQYASTWEIDGWTPPLLDVKTYNNLVIKTDPEIQKLTQRLALTQQDSSDYVKLSKERTAHSQKAFTEIQKLYSFSCVDGNKKSFSDISDNLLPTGTGDCCAPKLLNYAFAHNLQPLSLAEFYFGKSKKSQDKEHLHFYEPCNEKCAHILPTMLGLHILYKDEHIVVVNKSAGLLSVPGRGVQNQDSVVSRLKRLYPICIEQPSVHRLDMDTSGIMVFALTKEAHRNLSIQFEKGLVKKKYLAVLDGNITQTSPEKKVGSTGRIELPFRLDIKNRPHQIYDEVYGKMGISDYTILAIKKNKAFYTESKYVTYVDFSPITGRTHQLRLHAMHKKGLGLAIIGDRLYGNTKEHFADSDYGKKGKRLMLQAYYITFTHPITDKNLSFDIPKDF